MRRFSFSSLRFRLLIIVLLAIVPAFGLILYDASEQRKLAINMAHEEAMRLARLVDNLHENIIKDAQVLLATIAQLPEIRQGSLAQCNTLMTDLVKKFPFYANLGIVDSKGYTFCNAVDPKSRAYAGDRPWFQRAIKKKKFSIGEYVIGRITDRPVLVCGYPVFDSVGQVKSVVFAAIDLSWFNRLAIQTKMPESTTFMVIDRKKTVLAPHPNPEKWVGKIISESPLIKAILTNGEGVMEAMGLEGITRLYAFLPLGNLPEGGIYVKVGIPKGYIMSPINIKK